MFATLSIHHYYSPLHLHLPGPSHPNSQIYVFHSITLCCITASIFDGSYGSEMEFNLEHSLDLLQDRQTRIGIAKYKWTNARVLLDYAVRQLGHAVKLWEEIGQAEPQ